MRARESLSLRKLSVRARVLWQQWEDAHEAKERIERRRAQLQDELRAEGYRIVDDTRRSRAGRLERCYPYDARYENVWTARSLQQVILCAAGAMPVRFDSVTESIEIPDDDGGVIRYHRFEKYRIPCNPWWGSRVLLWNPKQRALCLYVEATEASR